MRLVMASGNAHKAAEIREILSAHMIEQRPSWVGEVDENAETLAGNARLKARAICEATGTAAVADDTGLEVDALGGLPGVRRARFAGDSATDEENLRKLLKSLEAVPSDERGARFRTVAIVAFPDAEELVTEVVANGMIAEVPRGNGGFGYDSLFVPDEGTGLSFAEMSETEKNLISHRGKAFRALAQLLQS